MFGKWAKGLWRAFSCETPFLPQLYLLPNAKQLGAAVGHSASHLSDSVQGMDSGSENSWEFKAQSDNCDKNNPIQSIKKYQLV